MNQSLKTIIGIFVMILSIVLLAACSHDEPETKQIYGTYEGSTHAKVTSISSSEIIDEDTMSTSFSITKSDNGMTIRITGNNMDYAITKLPILDVTGNSNYKYTYKSNDGTLNITISSADFKIISATIMEINMKNDIRYDLSFSGKRD